jgi:hypothetical protein
VGRRVVAGAKLRAGAARKRRARRRKAPPQPLMPRRRRGVSQSKRRTQGRAGEETGEGRSWRSASIKRKTAGDSREIEKRSTASVHTHEIRDVTACRGCYRAGQTAGSRR